MFRRDKATSPAEPSKWAENVIFPGRAATNRPLDRDVGTGRDSVNPTGLLHSDQCLQGFCAIIPGF
jgi:hypothetical protein